MPNKHLTIFLPLKTAVFNLFRPDAVEYFRKKLKGIERIAINVGKGEQDLSEIDVIELIILYFAFTVHYTFAILIHLFLLIFHLITSIMKIYWSVIFRNESIVHAPGSTALNIISFVFSKKATEGVFMQVVADMREEHADALHDRRFHKARWIVFRDHVNLLLTVALYLATSVGKRLVSIWKIIP